MVPRARRRAWTSATRPTATRSTVPEIDDALAALDRDIQPLDIVLIRTGRDAFLDAPDYMIKGPGVTAEATRRLYELGTRVMGIDAWGWDAPLHLEAEWAKAKGEPGVFWAAHQCDLAYSQIERLVQPRRAAVRAASRSPASRCGSSAAAPAPPASSRSSTTEVPYRLLGPDGQEHTSEHPGTLGGHRRSRIYGRLDCPAALRAIANGGPYPKHRVFFASEADAISAGYRPCASCLPANTPLATSDGKVPTPEPPPAAEAGDTPEE